MRMRLALSMLSLVALAVVATGASTVDLSRAFLAEAFKLSPADIRRIDNGQVVARTLGVKERREIATLGVVRIRTTPETYVERLRDIVHFKRTDGVLQIGRFGTPPRYADIASLTIDDAELARLRDCQVEDCGIRLSAEGIDRIRREIDWRTPDATHKAAALVRQLLVDYAAGYHKSGAAAAVEYADTPSPVNVAREFASLVDADTTTWKYVPRLRRHLLEYPAGPDEHTSDFVYWSKELVHRRSVVSITHVAIAAGVPGVPVDYAIASKQIYATHYFDASLGLTLLVRDCSMPTGSTFVVYLNRSRIDMLDGLFGGVARRMVSGKARSLVAEQLARLQRMFADTVATQALRTD